MKSDWRAIVVLILAAAVLVLGSLAVYTRISGDKAPAKPKALTIEDKAGIALTRDFNAAYKGQGAITRIVMCKQNPQKPSEFACAAVVKAATSSETICGGFVFTYVNGVTAPENIAKIDARNCA